MICKIHTNTVIEFLRTIPKRIDRVPLERTILFASSTSKKMKKHLMTLKHSVSTGSSAKITLNFPITWSINTDVLEPYMILQPLIEIFLLASMTIAPHCISRSASKTLRRPTRSKAS